MAPDVLQAPLVLEYPFTRSTGPVIGAFLTGLRDGVICGIRRSDGTVLCPPQEYDPLTAEPLTELVEVGQAGEVLTWAWNGDPRPMQPFDRPFAWALIRLDGADTSMLHAVFAVGAAEMSTGMRVRAVWRAEREGHIADIAGFEPIRPGLAQAVRPAHGRVVDMAGFEPIPPGLAQAVRPVHGHGADMAGFEPISPGLAQAVRPVHGHVADMAGFEPISPGEVQ